jgi:hypothetical protein
MGKALGNASLRTLYRSQTYRSRHVHRAFSVHGSFTIRLASLNGTCVRADMPKLTRERGEDKEGSRRSEHSVARPEECMQGLARCACVRSGCSVIGCSPYDPSDEFELGASPHECARCTVSASDSRGSRCSTRPIERGSPRGPRGPPGVALGTSLVTPLCSQRSPAYDRDRCPVCGVERQRATPATRNAARQCSH